jgi:hypothetical protein
VLKVKVKNKKNPRCTAQAEKISLHYDKSMFERGVGVKLCFKVETEVATGR